jgi:hypothetical protein
MPLNFSSRCVLYATSLAALVFILSLWLPWVILIPSTGKNAIAGFGLYRGLAEVMWTLPIWIIWGYTSFLVIVFPALLCAARLRFLNRALTIGCTVVAAYVPLGLTCLVLSSAERSSIGAPFAAWATLSALTSGLVCWKFLVRNADPAAEQESVVS